MTYTFTLLLDTILEEVNRKEGKQFNYIIQECTLAHCITIIQAICKYEV